MSLPPFRRLEPADPERPLSASAEELTKDWIVRLIEHTPLEQVRKLPTERIAREVPPLIEEILRAVLVRGETPDVGPGSELQRRIEELASLRDEGEDAGAAPRRRRARDRAAARREGAALRRSRGARRRG